MRKSQKIRNPTHEEFEQWLDRTIGMSSMLDYIFGLIGVVASLLTLLFSISVSKTVSSKAKTDWGYLTPNVFYFVGGIILLGSIIVAIASLIRWKNRDLISLKKRLSEIYLAALSKSALNPQPHVTSNE